MALSCDGSVLVVGSPAVNYYTGLVSVFKYEAGGYSRIDPQLLGSQYTKPQSCGEQGSAQGNSLFQDFYLPSSFFQPKLLSFNILEINSSSRIFIIL